MCDDKTCIPDTSECNFENDCNDGSDEMTCSKIQKLQLKFKKIQI